MSWKKWILWKLLTFEMCRVIKLSKYCKMFSSSSKAPCILLLLENWNGKYDVLSLSYSTWHRVKFPLLSVHLKPYIHSYTSRIHQVFMLFFLSPLYSSSLFVIVEEMALAFNIRCSYYPMKKWPGITILCTKCKFTHTVKNRTPLFPKSILGMLSEGD